MAAGCVSLAALRLCGDVSAQAVRLLLTLLAGVSAYAAGRRCGYHGRHRGILMGCVCAGSLWLLLLCGCVLTQGSGRTLPVRLAVMLLAGAAGGIRGVNRKLKRSPD